MNLESRAKECVQCQSLISKGSILSFICAWLFSTPFLCCAAGWNILSRMLRLLPDFLLDHINNFALCMLLMLILGIIVLSFEGKFRGITAAALVMSVLNIGYECFIPIRNTPDILDAVFGVIGVAIAYVFLILLRKNGLIAK